jgi:hypothetical protein
MAALGKWFAESAKAVVKFGMLCKVVWLLIGQGWCIFLPSMLINAAAKCAAGLHTAKMNR